MEEMWKTAIAVGGLAAIGAFIFWSLYKHWLTLPIFSQLSKRHTFIIMLVFLALTFASAIAILVTHVELKRLEIERQVDSTQSSAEDIGDEMAWRLSELIRIFGILESDSSKDRVTVQEYQSYSDYVDKLFTGEVYLHKQHDRGRLLSLIVRLISIEETKNLEEFRTYLAVLERTHWDKRDYAEVIKELKRYQALIQAEPNTSLQPIAPIVSTAELGG